MNRTILSLLLLSLACSRGGDEQGKRKLFSRGDAGPAAPAAFDWAHPEAALALGAGDAARRIGGFEWTAAVDWTVTRDGEPPRQVHVAERHTLRQAASGEFDVEADVDPGEGDDARSGRRVVWTGGMTYAKGAYGPADTFRERPTDHGRDAARFRDESFAVAADVARLLGPALRIEPAGGATVAGRAARKYALRFVQGAAPAPAAAPLGRSGDADTKARLAFLEGRTPLAAEGELLLDADTGVPLSTHLRATFGVQSDPKVRAQVELRSEIRTVGAAVAAVVAPKKTLPDERKPPGVSDALEAAGLKTRAQEAAGEPEDDSDQ